MGKVGIRCHNALTCNDVNTISAHFCHRRSVPPVVTCRHRFLTTGKLVPATYEGLTVRIVTRLKYGLFRLLGVVSPSGAYPLPPRWALSKKGRRQFYEAPPARAVQSGCQFACCNLKPQADAYGARTIQADRDTAAYLASLHRGGGAC
jgi:hypothetical protein